MRDETISVSTLKSPLPLVNQTRPAYFLQVILQLKEWSVTEEIHYIVVSDLHTDKGQT